MRIVRPRRSRLTGDEGSDRLWVVSRWALTVAITVCLWVPLVVVGQVQTQVRIDPPSAQVRTGGSVTLDIVVADVQDLYGLDVRLAFDPTQVEVLDADPEKEGVQIQPGDFLYPDFMVRNQADNQAGTIWFAINQLNPHEAVSGTGAVASITFRGKAAGTSSLSFTYHLLGTRQGEPIEAVTQDGQITVEGGAAAPTWTPSPLPTETKAETKVPPTETPVPPAPTDTPLPTATLPPDATPTWTVAPPLPTDTLVPPAPEPTAPPATEPVATPTPKAEEPTEAATAVPEQAPPTFTPTTEPTSPPVPSPTPTSRRLVAVVTPTVAAPIESGDGSSSMALYGLVFVAAIGLLIWLRHSGVTQ